MLHNYMSYVKRQKWHCLRRKRDTRSNLVATSVAVCAKVTRKAFSRKHILFGSFTALHKESLIKHGRQLYTHAGKFTSYICKPAFAN